MSTHGAKSEPLDQLLNQGLSRRDLLRISGIASAAVLINWECPALAKGGKAHKGEYDAIIIGAGLGGLSCAGFLARNGFRPLVIERHDKAGGYATSFPRGAFTCEVSLHGVTGSSLKEELLRQLGVWDKITFVPYENSWSAIYPDFSLDLPAGDLNGIKELLINMFPSEGGLSEYMDCWKNLLAEIERFFRTGMPEDPSQFPVLYPTWWSMMGKTLADLQNEYNIQNQRLRAILSQSWVYYGGPPSQIPAWFYEYASGSYYSYGNFNIRGTSQSLSDALVRVITDGGGEVILKTEVTEIILDNGKAVGVKAKGKEYYANAVVSNAAVPQTFGELIPESEVPQEYIARISSYQVSPSSFNVWLGLNRDITTEIPQSNVIVYLDYDQEKAYEGSLACDPDKSAFTMVHFDKLVADFSPKGCSSIVLSMLSGYDPWQQYEADYFAGKKKKYYEEKNRISERLISLAEGHLLPGLRQMIIMQDASTPLTNVRYTLNNRGAVYGYAQAMDNSGLNRLGQRTPIERLYLASAWSYPGGGYEPVLFAVKEAFKCMIEDWFGLVS